MDDFDLFASSGEDAEAATLTQQALVDTQQNLGQMLDIMPIGLLIHTEQGIVFANRHACGLFQAEPAQLRGHHLLDFAAVADADAVARALQATFADPDATTDLECAIERGDGTSRLTRTWC